MENASGIRLGAVGKTPIYVEISFLILAGFFVVIQMENGAPIAQALLWIPILFVSILIHELGHAGAIAAFGFGGSQITLGGFGGYTLNARRALPWQDVLISLAGPFSSFLLAWVVGIGMRTFPAYAADPMLAALFPLLRFANIFWGIFNLMPVYPLDGGQVVRNFTKMFTTDQRSIAISAWSSLVIASLLVVYGLYSRSFFLAVIAGMLLFQNWRRLQSRMD